MIHEILEPDYGGSFTNKQQLFMRFYTAVLMDLVVINLFDEYWDNVEIGPFSISLLVAVTLQVLLKITLNIEHKLSEWFNTKQGAFMKFLKILSLWAVLFISKLVILEALSMIFGENVKFKGVWHGVIAFILVVTVMLIAEQIAVKVYQRLGKSE